MTRSRQKGLTTVEFSIIGLVAMVVLFALIEFSRLVFTVNALSEATRRGGSNSPIVGGLTTANVAVDYLNQTGAPTGAFGEIRFVRVRITGFQHTLLIPLFGLTFALPEYPSTLPRESLGVPRVGAGPLPC